MTFAPRRHGRFLDLPAIACLAVAAMTSPPAAASPVELQLQRANSGHVLLPVTIDGDGPFTFLLDTGATHTAIAAPLAEQFGFVSAWALYGDVQALTTRFEAERFALEDVRLAGQDPMDLVSVVIPVEEGQPIPVSGLLGADAIAASRYDIDFGAGRLTLDAHPARHADGQVADSGLLVGTAGLRRGVHRIHVMLDSGSARTLVNRRLQRQVSNRTMVVRMGGTGSRIGGIDGNEQEEARPVILRHLQIGGLCIPAVAALEADLDIFRALGWEHQPAMVIGMDVLQHARVRVDRETGTYEIDASAASDALACERG